MTIAAKLGRGGRGAAAALALMILGGCATERAPQHFFAMPERDVAELRLPGRTDYEQGEFIILVAGGEGFDGRTLQPKVFRSGVVDPVYIGKPVQMLPGNPHWWSIGAPAPAKYFIYLQVDRGPARQHFEIAVAP